MYKNMFYKVLIISIFIGASLKYLSTKNLVRLYDCSNFAKRKDGHCLCRLVINIKV